MGWFGRRRIEGVKRGGYRRPRAESAPPGWIAAQAVVGSCEFERTNTRIGTSQGNQARVFRTCATYVVLDEDGAPLEVTAKGKFRRGDLPQIGERLVIAYDPAEPTEAVILTSEEEYADELKAWVHDMVHHGAEAPCEILGATPTGRVSRPAPPPVRQTLTKRAARALMEQALAAQPNPAPEMILRLRAQPQGWEPFELTVALWDRDIGFTPGLRGMLLFDPADLTRGYPIFPTVEQRAVAGAEAVAVARDAIVAAFA